VLAGIPVFMHSFPLKLVSSPGEASKSILQ